MGLRDGQPVSVDEVEVTYAGKPNWRILGSIVASDPTPRQNPKNPFGGAETVPGPLATRVLLDRRKLDSDEDQHEAARGQGHHGVAFVWRQIDHIASC